MLYFSYVIFYIIGWTNFVVKYFSILCENPKIIDLFLFYRVRRKGQKEKENKKLVHARGE